MISATHRHRCAYILLAPGWHVNCKWNIQAVRQLGSQADRQACGQAVKLAGWLASWLTGQLSGWLARQEKV